MIKSVIVITKESLFNELDNNIYRNFIEFINYVLVCKKGKSIGVFIGAGIPASIFNFCLIQGYLVAPNPGYISAVNIASISLLTVLYKVFFKDTLTLKKMLGVIGILIGLIILFV